MSKLRKSLLARRMIAMCLACLMLFIDSSVVNATEYSIQENTVSAGDMDISEIPVEQKNNVSSGDAGQNEDTDMPQPEISQEDTTASNDMPTVSGGDPTVSGGDLTVSGGDFPIETMLPLREPEQFYQDTVEENYGELVGYDIYSRTYHVNGNQYITVIGNDAATYIDE